MSLEDDSIDVNVDFSEKGVPFSHFYSGIGYKNTDFTYTPQYRRMYSYLASYPSETTYVRMHNILTSHGRGDYYFHEGDDYNGRGKGAACTVTEEGYLNYDWTHIDQVYDILVEHKMKPIVEVERMPTDL